MSLTPPAAPSRTLPDFRSALSAFASVGTSTAAGQVIGFAALAFVARRVGPANLGDYNFAISVLACVGLGNIGVGVLAIRDLTLADSDQRREVATETAVLLLGLNGASLVAMLVAAPLIAPSPLAADLLRVLSGVFLTNALLFEWALLGLGRFRWVAVGRVGGQVLYAILVLLLLGRGRGGVVDYAVFNVAGYALTSAISIAAFLSAAGFIRPAAGLARRLVRRFHRSLRVGYPLVVLQFYLSLNLILLGYLGSAQETGQYAAASRLPIALTSLGMVWGSVLYPHVARAGLSELAGLTRDLGRATSFTLGAGALVVSGAGVFAVPVMTTFFGQAFRAASSSFVVLSAAAILLLADTTLGGILLARDRERQYAVGVSVGALANALLDLPLIPAAGAAGAAAATLAVETAIFIFFVRQVSRQVGRIPIAWSLVVRCLLTGLVGAGAVVVTDPDGLLARAGLFLVATPACGLAAGLGRPRVWRAAWSAS